ncbi:MAG: tetratricopeptide repeat protein [Rhodospirillales bacterium]|nr:tetratricopeptide repeat protein [Rhodospirillales bacterium]
MRRSLGVAPDLFGGSPACADQDDPRLDRLFGRLNVIDNGDKDEVARITAEIWSIWRQSGRPGLDMKMQEGQRFMKHGTLHSALGNFDFIVKVRPNFAEGWHKRATVYYLMGDYASSIADIQKTVELEPRHFGAYAGLGLIYLKMGNEPAALRALEQALTINPHLAGTRATVDELRRKINGPKL